MDETVIRCEECKREVDEFTAVAEKWRFFSDGSELLPYCPDCSEQATVTELLAQASVDEDSVDSSLRTEGID
jgi:hypothetical protein